MFDGPCHTDVHGTRLSQPPRPSSTQWTGRDALVRRPRAATTQQPRLGQAASVRSQISSSYAKCCASVCCRSSGRDCIRSADTSRLADDPLVATDAYSSYVDAAAECGDVGAHDVDAGDLAVLDLGDAGLRHTSASASPTCVTPAVARISAWTFFSMRWDTKPDNRISRTSAHPAPTRRIRELLARVCSSSALPALWRDAAATCSAAPDACIM